MNTQSFTGKARDYASARPSYPQSAINYICSFIPKDAVFADMGAGTGKFTELIAKRGYEIYAVEPNADMREQLIETLLNFKNVKIMASTAESTDIPDCSVDVIVCAQAIGWFNLVAFKQECKRIGKHDAMIVSIYNEIPGLNNEGKKAITNKEATNIFFRNPAIQEFANPMFYSRDKWMQFVDSISNSPLETREVFDRENVDGILRRDVITKVYSEKIFEL